MPPYVNRKCPHCQAMNHIDLGEIIDVDKLYKDDESAPPGEYYVECQFCHQTFVVIIQGGQHDPGG